ncbi:MAG: phosphopantetheine-binding protein [Lysobacter sp.]
MRIDLSEIEAHLDAQASIAQSVVTWRDGDGGEWQPLVAYVVAADLDREPDETAIRAALLTRMPAYMVPGQFVFLPAMPLTPRGEIDRHALPAPARTGTEQNQPPSTPIEEMLVALWTQVLGRAPPGVGANFFELGGRSLLASQFASLIEQQLSIEMPLWVVFEQPVLRDQASWLARQPRGCSSSPDDAGAAESDSPAPITETRPVRVGVALCSQSERALTMIWAACLGIAAENIGVTDSFFEIGGNSLLSIRLQAEIREILGIEVAMADLFQYPTIQDLARFIDGATTQHADRSSALKSAKDRVLRARARNRNVR